MKVSLFFPALSWNDPKGGTSFQTSLQQMLQMIAGAINYPDYGSTSARPVRQLVVGQPYFDTTLNYPVWWNGAHWVNASGTQV